MLEEMFAVQVLVLHPTDEASSISLCQLPLLLDQHGISYPGDHHGHQLPVINSQV
jgi:hypothetical protein